MKTAKKNLKLKTFKEEKVSSLCFGKIPRSPVLSGDEEGAAGGQGGHYEAQITRRML